MRNKEIKAIYEGDLDRFLDKLELLELLEKGELVCAVCNEKITRDNFRFIFSEDNEIKVCCSSIQCYEKVISKID